MAEIQRRIEDIGKVEPTKKAEVISNDKEKQPAKEEVVYQRKPDFAELKEDQIPIPPLTKGRKWKSW